MKIPKFRSGSWIGIPITIANIPNNPIALRPGATSLPLGQPQSPRDNPFALWTTPWDPWDQGQGASDHGPGNKDQGPGTKDQGCLLYTSDAADE